jgi:PAS domain S-box-containing protein
MSGAGGNTRPLGPWARIGGPIITLALAVLIELSGSTSLHVTNPPAFFVLAIVFSAFRGGLRPGLISAAVAWVYIAYFFSRPDQPFQFSDENLRRVIVWAFVMPLTAFMVGLLNRRTARALAETEVAAIRQVQLEDRARASEALKASEQRFRAIIDRTNDAIEVVDPETGRFLDVNEAACLAHGYTREEYLALTVPEINPLMAVRSWEEIREELRRAGSRVFESQHRRKDGSVFPVEVNATYTRLDRDYMLAVVRDVTDRKRAEALMNGQKRVLELVAGGTPLAESLTALVRLIEEHAPGMLGSILLLDEEGVQLHHGAAPSLPPEYVRAIDGGFVGLNVGSCGAAAYRKEAVFVEDIATDPLWNEYKAVALPHGLRACWSTPIFDAQRRVLGTFAMYYRQPALPQPDHQQLIEMTTHTAAIAIGRQRVERALRESAERLRLAVQASNVGLWDWDFQTNRVVYSREWKRQIGYEEHEIGNEFGEWERRVHPDDLAPTTAAVRAYLDGKHSEHAVEFRLRHKDGLYRWIYARGEVFRDPSGKPVRMLGCHVDVTDRKRAEEQLRKTERQLRTLVEHFPDFIARFDTECRHTYVNPSVRRAFDAPLEHFVGKTPLELALPGNRERDEVLQDGIRRALAEGVPNTVEVEWETPRGRRSFEVRHVPELDESGTSVGVIGIARDVTERKRTEEQLRQREADLKLALDAGRLGAWKWDLVTDEVVWSPTCKALYGLPQDAEMSYDRFLAAVHPDDRASVGVALKRAAETGADYEEEKRCIWPDGSVHWTAARGRVYAAAVGRRMSGVTMDVTDRKRAEEQLRASEERYRSVVTALAEGIVFQDATGAIRTCNASAERILGRTLDQMSGECSLNLSWRTIREDGSPFPGEDHPAMVTLGTGRPCINVVMGVQKPDDSVSWITINSEPLFHAGESKPYGVVTSFSDITDRKRTEDLLRASLREKEVLLKEVHHRVKNNLQLINSLLALQASVLKDRAAVTALAESQNRVRAMALVHEHLYRSGDLASIRLAGHVEALCAQLYRACGVDSGRIALDLRVADLTLDLDRSIRCGLVINELVSNALKHAFPSGREGRITVQLDAHAEEGWYTLVVADNGVGFPPAFDPGRSDSLGLQLVADLTDQLSGNLAWSRDGGTAVTVRFPCSRP